MQRAETSGRSQRRKARTMAAILEAAERRLAEPELRVDEIAADADVAVGSIYNHFGSKEGLEQALVDRSLELFEIYMDEGRDADASALEQLLETAGRLARFGREQEGHLRLLVRQRSGARVAERFALLERRTAALVEAAVRRGDALPVNARHAAGFLWSAWLGMLTLAPADEARLRGMAEVGLRIVVGGLASDSARAENEIVRALLESNPIRRPPAQAPRLGLAIRHEAVAPDLRAQLPGLGLWTTVVEARPGATTPAAARRLRSVRTRLSSARATGIPGESAPWAYRLFARRLGVGADTPLGPAEEVALQRFDLESPVARGLPDDALLIAALETGVPVLAFDADAVEGVLHMRHARAGERLGERGRELVPGEAVITDGRAPAAVVFGDRAPEAQPGPATERMVLAAIQVKGVPDVSAQEALWTAAEVLRGGG